MMNGHAPLPLALRRVAVLGFLYVSNGPNGGGTYHREVAIEKLNFNADGTIQKVTPSSGLTF
jgi:hypothetical protein